MASGAAAPRSDGENRLGNAARVEARALLLGRRLRLKSVASDEALAVQPLTVPVGARGLAVLFRYGAVVLFNVTPAEQRRFLDGIESVIEDPLNIPEEEEADILLRATGEETVDAAGTICLQELTSERLIIIADVMAKSVVLALDESRIAHAFDLIEPVAQSINRSWRGSVPTRHLLDHISDVLLTQHHIVGRVEVTEKPDILWDHPEMERLYARLHEEYELQERDRALSRKLDLIAQTARTSLGLIESRRALRVEWYIVILILVEIVLTVYEMFIVGDHAG